MPTIDAMPIDTNIPETNANRRAFLNGGKTRTKRQGSVITKNKIDTQGYFTLL